MKHTIESQIQRLRQGAEEINEIVRHHSKDVDFFEIINTEIKNWMDKEAAKPNPMPIAGAHGYVIASYMRQTFRDLYIDFDEHTIH